MHNLLMYAWNVTCWLFTVNSHVRSVSTVSVKKPSVSIKEVGWVAACNQHGGSYKEQEEFWMAAEDTMKGGPDAYVSVDSQIKVRLTIWNSHGGILVRRTAQR